MRLHVLAPIVVIAIVLLVPAGPTAAQVVNGLSNPTFDTDLSHWTAQSPSEVQPVWAATPDANNSSSSGSALLRDISADPAVVWQGLAQCVAVASGASYHLAGTTGIYSGQPTTGKVEVIAYFYATSNCTGSKLGTPASFTNTQANSHWNTQSVAGTTPSGTQSALVILAIEKDQAGGEFRGYFDNMLFYASGGTSGGCVPDSTHLCLTGNRFRVSVEWTNYNTNVTAPATAVPFRDESGFFYFQDPNKIEVMVQVKNACQSFQHFWLFYAATTDVAYTLTVTDTTTNQTETYSNPAHSLAVAGTDETDFGACP